MHLPGSHQFNIDNQAIKNDKDGFNPNSPAMVCTNPYISVVIPIFNEADNIRPLTTNILETVISMPWSWELIYIDDGSTDGSSHEIQCVTRRDTRIRYLCKTINRGQSYAFREGFRMARGKLIVTMDGDMQNDPNDIPMLLNMVEDETAVCGIRQKRCDNYVRRFSSKFANFIRRLVFHDGVEDTGCSLKVMPRDAVLNFPVFNGAHRFYPVFLRAQGIKIKQVNVNHRPRLYGKSKYGIVNRGLHAFIDMMGVAWLISRTHKNQVSHVHVKEECCKKNPIKNKHIDRTLNAGLSKKETIEPAIR